MTYPNKDTSQHVVAAPEDLSPRVVDLARVIDRLPPGKYEIEIHKPEVRAGAWEVRVSRMENLQTIHLRKHSPME